MQTLLLIIGSDQNYSGPESPIHIFLLISVPDTEITPDQSFWCKHYYRLQGPINIIPDQSLRYIYFSWSVCPIPKLLLIRVSGAIISLDYRVRSKLPLTRVSDTYISLDQCARYRNYSWSEFLVQLLLLIIGSDHNYSWPQSPIPITLLISLPDTEITPDQSFWCKHYSWLQGPIKITPDQSLRYLYFPWSVSPIPKLLLIRISGANITLDYRVRSKLLRTRVSDTYISLDQCARYRNYSWSEFLVQTLL